MEILRVTREVRLTKWAEILRSRQESGWTIRQYCEANGVNEKSYYYWQRQLRAIACESLAASEEKAPVGWAKYNPAVATNTSELTIEIGGCLIRVNESVGAELLSRTCRVLRSIC